MVMAKTVGAESSTGLVRAIDWRGAFWIASGVPALVLFSIAQPGCCAIDRGSAGLPRIEAGNFRIGE